ncbi:hypothetical protein [Bacillus sp. FJAT-27225]|nr:hypothetical protein [Bacillus sp. FJAT-27225]
MPNQNKNRTSLKYSIWDTRVDEKQKETIEESPLINHKQEMKGKKE